MINFIITMVVIVIVAFILSVAFIHKVITTIKRWRAGHFVSKRDARRAQRFANDELDGSRLIRLHFGVYSLGKMSEEERCLLLKLYNDAKYYLDSHKS